VTITKKGSRKEVLRPKAPLRQVVSIKKTQVIKPKPVLKSKPKRSVRHPFAQKVVLPVKPRLRLAVIPPETSKPRKIQPDSEPSLTIKSELDKKQPDRWSDCGQIFYTSGQAFGIASNLRTVYLGTQNKVQEFFSHGKMEKGLTRVQEDTLTSIKDTMKQTDNPERANTVAPRKLGLRPLKLKRPERVKVC
jgi:hypothetical protein